MSFLFTCWLLNWSNGTDSQCFNEFGVSRLLLLLLLIIIMANQFYWLFQCLVVCIVVLKILSSYDERVEDSEHQREQLVYRA